MKDFMGPDFLLESGVARRLYHDCAADLPIYDYHCHLPPKEIAENRRFDNLAQIWLDGDHYKWRAMRTVGFDEELITGNASDYDKYKALARTIPQCIGNPLYHWTHLELKRPFGIAGKIFGPDTADTIWHETRTRLAEPAFSARGILQQMNVRMLGTTDDPTDDLRHHRTLAGDKSFSTQVLPSWRPDPVFKIELDGFPDYLDRLAEVADVDIDSFAALLAALERRLDHFDKHGCRAADHGIEVMRYAPVPEASDLDGIMARRRRGNILSELEIAQFSTAVQLWLARAYELRGWVMQLHIGPLRNNSSRRFRELGANVGCDSIGDRPYAEPLSRFLDELDSERTLPKTILYGINPRDNQMLATMAGNFQGDGVPGKVQFGAAWWFNDQKDGMIRHLTCLSQMGLLSQFVGMLTDSRSFLSYTRHEYFRRILCNMIGDWVEKGEAPADFDLLGGMIRNICCDNTKTFFGLDKVKLM